jgi:ribA/ribD-fused uncharacterized protein
MSTQNKIIAFYRANDEYGCFSNFYMTTITIDRQKYCCNEQYIMYKKALLFNNDKIAQKIMKT